MNSTPELRNHSEDKDREATWSYRTRRNGTQQRYLGFCKRSMIDGWSKVLIQLGGNASVAPGVSWKNSGRNLIQTVHKFNQKMHCNPDDFNAVYRKEVGEGGGSLSL